MRTARVACLPSGLVERERDGVIERKVAPRCHGDVEQLTAAGLDEPCFAACTVAGPAAERRTHVIVLDRAPKPPGPIRVPANPGHAGEQTQAQDTAAVVVKLL